MATNYEKWVSMGEKFGYSGKELHTFVTQEQDRERAERAERREVERQEAEREAQRREAERESCEAERKERQAIREYELSKLKLEVELRNTRSHHSSGDNQTVRARVPKLPEFKERTDSMDAYLERFERFATSQC